MLAKNPGVTAIAVIALTLGIGLTATMFSIVYGALYRGLPFAQAERIMHLERNNLSQDIESMEVTIHDFIDWREQQTAFNDIAGFWSGTGRCGFVIIVLDGDLVHLAAYLDAALLVDALDSQIIAVLGVLAVG